MVKELMMFSALLIASVLGGFVRAEAVYEPVLEGEMVWHDLILPYALRTSE